MDHHVVLDIDNYYNKIDEIEKEINRIEKEKETKELQYVQNKVCECGYKITKKYKFCPNCGSKVLTPYIMCSCGIEIFRTLKYCSNYGISVEGLQKVIENYEAEAVLIYTPVLHALHLS